MLEHLGDGRAQLLVAVCVVGHRVQVGLADFADLLPAQPVDDQRAEIHVERHPVRRVSPRPEAGGPRPIDTEQMAEPAVVRDEHERGDRVTGVRH